MHTVYICILLTLVKAVLGTFSSKQGSQDGYLDALSKIHAGKVYYVIFYA